MNGNKWFLLIVIGAALILGAASLALAQDDNAAIVEQYFDSLWNRDQIYFFGRLLVPDVVHHDSTLAEPVTGNKALLEYIARYRRELPGLRFTVGNVTTEGDQVTAELTATFKDAQVPLQAKARIADGKLVETWFDVNALVTNPDIKAAVAQIEADNLALAEKFVAFEQNVASYVADLNQFRAKFLDLFRTDLLYHDWGNSLSWNLQYLESLRWYRAITQAFPDRAFTAEIVVAQGDKVYIHYTQTGTFANTFSHAWITLQPTGKPVVEEGVLIFRIQDGKIAEEWWYPDNPLYWAATALNLERGINTDQPMQEIYDLNKPK